MIIVDVARHGQVAVDDDDTQAHFAEAGRLSARRTAAAGTGRSVRVLVEVQRRFGGLAPRALLGAEFLVATGTDAVIEVGYSRESDDTVQCRSRLWERPYTVGLPEEFASAVLHGLQADGVHLPAGVLRVDRAGFDEINSSAVVFGQAAGVLACALASILGEKDVAAEVRALVSTW